MSEIKFKDVRYYDLISQDQLDAGKTILITVKGQPAGVMTPVVQWAKDNLLGAFVVYGTVNDLDSICDDLPQTNQSIAVVLTGAKFPVTEIMHWARTKNVTVFLAHDATATLPRYHVLLPSCVVQFTYDHTGQLTQATAIRNQQLATGWVVDFTEDK